MRSGYLDVLLAGYSGFTVVPAWHAAAMIYQRTNGLDGVSMMIDNGRYGAATAVVLAFAWCSAHVMLPVPAIVAAVGIRWRRGWARDLGMALGLVMVLLVPIGTLVGIWTCIRLYRDADQFR